VKLVIDINVLVSGALWKGNPARLLDAVLEGAAILCVSPAILAEFEAVTQRDKFRKRLEESGRSAQDLISQFRSAAVVIENRPIPVPAALRDPDDVHVLACALAAGADAIVSGDDDLISIRAFEGIPILTVRQALERLNRELI
jgi:putative PIN family toxin of toxin-antitoxin system